MKQVLTDSLQRVIPATGGIVAIEQIDHTNLILQVLVGIASLIPTFKELFKKRK